MGQVQRLEPELASFVRRHERTARGAAFVRRGFLLLAPCFGLAAELAWSELVPRWLCLLAFPLGFFCLVALSLLLWPVRLDPMELDRRGGAQDALATLLLDRSPTTAVRCLVVRFAKARIAAAEAPLRATSKRWLRRATVLAFLVLLALLFFPGSRTSLGPGRAESVGSAGRGTGPDAQAGAESAPGQGKQERRPTPEPEATAAVPPPEPAPEKENQASQPEPERGTEPERKIDDSIVFPDYRGEDRSSERQAPSIERSPLDEPRRPQSGGRAKPRPDDAEPEVDDATWQKLRERALARGRLAPWEGRVLEHWGRALER